MSEIEALRSQLERLQKLISEAEQRIATDGKLIEKLQTELTAIKAQASDATEYVLAGINKDLRADYTWARSCLREIRDHHPDPHFEEWAREFAAGCLEIRPETTGDRGQ